MAAGHDFPPAVQGGEVAEDESGPAAAGRTEQPGNLSFDFAEELFGLGRIGDRRRQAAAAERAPSGSCSPRHGRSQAKQRGSFAHSMQKSRFSAPVSITV